MNTKKRIFYLDFIRAIACLAIFTTHFNASICQYQSDGTFLFPQNAAFPIYIFDGIYLGDWGSSLFFMLSGAGLQISVKSQSKVALGPWYRKRAKNMFPLYWLCWFLFTAINFLWNHCLPDAPLWNLIFSAIGLDGYLLTLGLPVGKFYVVGEWFFGCLLLIYLIWPFIHRFSMKCPAACTAVFGVLYLCLVKRVSNVFFLLRIPEILFGMYFVRYIREPKGKYTIAALAVLAAAMLLQSRITNLSYTILVSASSFVLLAHLSSFLKVEKIRTYIAKFAVLSWPVFLVHHQIIAMICPAYAYDGLALRNRYMLYVVVLIITLAAAWSVEKLNGKIMNLRRA